MYVGVPGEETGIKKDGSDDKLSYAEAVAERSKIEEQIGLSLAKNAKIPNLAKKIHQKSRITLEKKDKKEIETQANIFGGARASQEGIETLGRYVFETMHHIEKDKAAYSESKTADHPYFPTEQKKPEFDEPLASLNWEDLPEDAKNSLAGETTSPFTNLPASTYNELDFKGKLTLLKDFRYKDDRKWGASGGILPQTQEARNAINAYKDNPTEEKRETAFTAIKTALLQVNLSDKEKATLGAALDIVADKHTNGDHTNLVRKKGDGGVKDQWIEDTVKAGKPIISGPSGHTLRYLNFWAEKRNEQKEAEGANPQTPEELSNWPSLETARLVMMANLMPARHHSYDEIMTASIGIKDNVSDALKYEHKSSYEDLSKDKHKDNEAGEIADAAYKESRAKDADEANTEGIAAAEQAIKKQRDNRKTLQSAKDELLSKLSKATLGQLQNAITAITTNVAEDAG